MSAHDCTAARQDEVGCSLAAAASSRGAGADGAAAAHQPAPSLPAHPRCSCRCSLNGIDNGAIQFTHVRIPRENLLDRFATGGCRQEEGFEGRLQEEGFLRGVAADQPALLKRVR